MKLLRKIYGNIFSFLKVKIKPVCNITFDKIKQAYGVTVDKIKNHYRFVKLKVTNFDIKKLKAKPILAKSCAMTMVFGILMSTIILFPSTKVSALEVKYEEKTVGYVESKSKIDEAKSEISENVEGNNPTSITNEAEQILDKKIKTKPIKIEREDIDNNVNSLKESIVEASDDFDEGYGVFVGDELCAVFKEESSANSLKTMVQTKATIQYGCDTLVTEKPFEIVKGTYLMTQFIELDKALIDDVFSKINFMNYFYYEKIEKLNYDTIYVANDKLTLGQNSVSTKGKKGICVYKFRDVYKNGVKITTENISTDITRYPKAKTVEVSREEYEILKSNKKSKKNKKSELNYAFPIKDARYYVSSVFGYRWGKVHKGIDLAVDEGSAIQAYRSGVVVKSGYHSSYGNYIIIDHGDKLKTLYAHCSSLLAKEGDKVEQCQVIALSGNTGNSTGPHLHFEVRVDGNKINPAKYIGLFIEDGEDMGRINKIIKSKNLTGDNLKFVNSIKDAAIDAYKHYNILPSLTISQAILESAWGKSSIGNNLFGIKAYSDWKGKKKYVWTSEERSDGSKYRTKCWFKTYDNIEDSVKDHTKLLLNSRYDKVREAGNYREACYAVKEAGYATSSDYAEKLIQLIETYGLYTWDGIDKEIDEKNSEKKEEKKKKEVKKNKTEDKKKDKKNNRKKGMSAKSKDVSKTESKNKAKAEVKRSESSKNTQSNITTATQKPQTTTSSMVTANKTQHIEPQDIEENISTSETKAQDVV